MSLPNDPKVRAEVLAQEADAGRVLRLACLALRQRGVALTPENVKAEIEAIRRKEARDD